jgi:hypothetical protein
VKFRYSAAHADAIRSAGADLTKEFHHMQNSSRGLKGFC